jgi:hypothetical protein
MNKYLILTVSLLAAVTSANVRNTIIDLEQIFTLYVDGDFNPQCWLKGIEISII